MFRTLIWIAALAAVAVFSQPVRADMPPSDYAAVVLKAQALDRQQRPVADLPLRFSFDLNGIALQDDGRSEGIMASGTRTVRTDASGTATLPLSGLPWTHEPRWFRGKIGLSVTLPHDPQREIRLRGR